MKKESFLFVLVFMLILSSSITVHGEIFGYGKTETDDLGLPYGQIYVKESIDTVTVDSDFPDVIITQFNESGESNLVIANSSNSSIDFILPGVYFVSFNTASMLSSGATVELEFNGYLDGVELDQLHTHRTIGSTQIGSISFSGFINVQNQGSKLDVRANIDSAVSRSLTVEDAQLNVIMMESI